MFDDTTYDYTQHLKEMGAPGGVFVAATTQPKKKEGGLSFKDDLSSRNPYDHVVLPKEVLPSEYEDDIGMLNRAARATGPQPELGEDVLEVLEALEDEGLNFLRFQSIFFLPPVLGEFNGRLFAQLSRVIWKTISSASLIKHPPQVMPRAVKEKIAARSMGRTGEGTCHPRG